MKRPFILKPLHHCSARLILLALLSTLNPQLSTLFAQGTAFSYQGQLNDNGQAANGLYDLLFAIYDSGSSGNLIAGPLTNGATAVSNGLFTVTLDFGSGVFTGPARWLEVDVRTNGSSDFTALSPRAPLTAVPYSITAGNLTGMLPASQLNGTMSLAQLPGAVLTNNEAGVNLNGSFIGNGAGITNVSLNSLNSGGAISCGGFFAVSSPHVGSEPQDVKGVDLYSNGSLALVCANLMGNTVMLLTNDGNGGFALAATYAVGNGPVAIAVADLNGDSRQDLAIANADDNALTVLTNNGNGGFAFAASVATGVNPSAVAAADVNGDGKVDLITANAGADTLSILTNRGNGTFALSSSPSVGPPGSDPLSVVAADVNGDGKTDLITADYSSSTLTVLTNNGSGGFVISALVPVGGRPGSLAAADVNGDRKMDLISANENNILTVLTNDGGGGFALAGTLAVGSAPYAVIAADVNGDTKPDLITANNLDNTLTILTNGGAGFMLAATVAVGANPASVAALDVNGDGRLDLVSANGGANNLTIVMNLPTVFNGFFLGDGAGLAGLNASSISSGTLDPTRLPPNLPGTLVWQNVAATSQQAQPNSGYIANNVAQVTITLPTAPNLGDIVRVSGAGAGGWKIAQNVGQSIRAPTTTPGTAGYLSAGQNSAIELQYIGNGQFLTLSHEGTLSSF